MARTGKAIRPPNVLCMLTQMVKMIARRTPRAAAPPVPHLPPHRPHHPHHPHHHLSPPRKRKRKRSRQQLYPQHHLPPEMSLRPHQRLRKSLSQSGLQAPQLCLSLNRRSLQQDLQVPLRNHLPVCPSLPLSRQRDPWPPFPALMSAPPLLSPSCPHPRNAGKRSPSLPWRRCQHQSLPQPPRHRSSLLALCPAKSPGLWSGPFETCPWTMHLWSRVGLRRCPEEVGAGLEAEAVLLRRRKLTQGPKWTWRCWPTWP